jgi:hypothetical protein
LLPGHRTAEPPALIPEYAPAHGFRGNPGRAHHDLAGLASGCSAGGRWDREPHALAAFHTVPLLDELLDAWERTNLHDVIERVERDGGDARTRLRRLFALAFSGIGPLRTELAVRDWARRDPAVAERVRRVDNRRVEYLRGLFGAWCPDEADVEARCLLALSLWIGNHFIAADHRARSRTEVLARAARLLEG